jgi:hypothetical protein
MRIGFLILAVLPAALAASAQAQQTCRAADITSDGVVGGPDFGALAACYGHVTSEIVPSGDYVGFVPAPYPDGIMGRDQACRGSFGPDGHWCTTGEISMVPDATALPEADLLVRPTPPVAGWASSSGVDWVSGALWGNCYASIARGIIVRRTGSNTRFQSCSTSESEDGIACCIDSATP